MPIEAIIVAIGAAVWKLFKELPEIFSGKNKGLREEAEFADKFFIRLKATSKNLRRRSGLGKILTLNPASACRHDETPDQSVCRAGA